MDHDNTNPFEWTDESRKSISDYLDTVEKVLLDQDVSRSERTIILGELESQIYSIVAAKTDSGASVSLLTVLNVLETLDTPESYRRSESMRDPLDAESRTEPAMPDVRSRTQAVRTKALSYLNRSRMDEFAIGSCISCLLAFFMALAAGRRNEGLLVVATFLLLAGCAAGWYSVYRIKRSEGKLWGGKWAFAGAMVLPVLLLNSIAILLLIETPLWMLVLTSAVIYLNYRLIQRVWSWIACQRMKHRPDVVIVEPPVTLSGGESVPAL